MQARPFCRWWVPCQIQDHPRSNPQPLCASAGPILLTSLMTAFPAASSSSRFCFWPLWFWWPTGLPSLLGSSGFGFSIWVSALLCQLPTLCHFWCSLQSGVENFCVAKGPWNPNKQGQNTLTGKGDRQWHLVAHLSRAERFPTTTWNLVFKNMSSNKPILTLLLGLPRWLRGKESACQGKRYRRHGFDP